MIGVDLLSNLILIDRPTELVVQLTPTETNLTYTVEPTKGKFALAEYYSRTSRMCLQYSVELESLPPKTPRLSN